MPPVARTGAATEQLHFREQFDQLALCGRPGLWQAPTRAQERRCPDCYDILRLGRTAEAVRKLWSER